MRSAHFTGAQWSPGAVGLEQKPGTLAPHLVADTCYSSFSEESACDLEIMAAAPLSPAFPFSFWLEKPHGQWWF